MADKSDEEEVVCEFFGIQITTKNPNVARVLQTDMGEFLNKDIKLVSRGNSEQSDSEKSPDRYETDEVDHEADPEESELDREESELDPEEDI